MKKLLFIALVITGAYACNQAVKTGEKGDGKEFKPYNSFCSNGDTNLCTLLPYDVAENFGFGYQSVLDSQFQPPFDAFSWQTFIALNWPADASGNPTGNSISANPGNKRVWEYYIDPSKAFSNGLLGGELKLHMDAAESNGQKFLYMDSKSPHDLGLTVPRPDEFVEADGKPLVDRNLNFTLYEIKVNNVEDTFIRNNKLNTAAGIYKYASQGRAGNAALELPESDSAKQNPGTIEVKTSWRILDPAKGDDTSRFYCRKATIYIDAAHTTNKKTLIVPGVTVGLVGMHIIRNTPKMSGFLIWTTFEHVDNAPEEGERTNGTRWSYYNKDCKDCPVNTPPPFQPGDNKQYLWSPTPPYASHYTDSMKGYGTQVVRENAIYKWTDVLNNWWRAKLQGTVWANYKLVGTQWERGEGLSSTKPAPIYLANTTLETYIQSTSSCIGCHSAAKVVFNQKDTVTTALSFLFPIYKH
ncbi:hypothetical protein [Polluticoccus soli]|uniref:hypothetical protein n=1 Tax=Polluticoccus soli TaxID=3034150 RepID=UPI0023E1C180|nr:hypothetical protein [Flavipsychrobacter sp. JY13-12]